VTTILIVDDNEPIRRLVSKILRREGYEIEEAFDGLEAMEKLNLRTFDAIVLDLMMPRANGFEVIAYLRQQKPEVLKRVVVMTAAMSQLSSDELREIGQVVAKPFEIDNLLQTVRTCLERAGLTE